jgi:hypothetical protein
MDASIVFKTEEGTLCSRIQFHYDFGTRVYYDVIITNYSEDVLYRVHPSQRPPRGILCLECDNLFGVPRMLDTVSDVRMKVLSATKVLCQQVDPLSGLTWNEVEVDATGEYVLVPCEF